MKQISPNLYIKEGHISNIDFTNITSKLARELGFGALSTFEGIVRDDKLAGENLDSPKVEALKFQIYEPLFIKWMSEWQEKAKEKGVILALAHSYGVVKVGETSYIASVMSKHRRAVLDLFASFVDDFKANAPIWKFDVVDGKEIYALERSTALKHSGLLK
ncbi:molybdenum cofactor biosynthesis protein MoaE [Helicobacter sp. 11S02629-2]|uniref:molybdopterin synthase catalytic subunit n=1 Tax=Helicobacter sp. 11S02629-2 TaxID=1476195 RepID=UPI000BA5FE78|nr:molybdenum cofactor biosynthesis protein MoaE [Helicobacter sp. 11S02629-2]PAF42410.1 hypothetical protein BKH40_07840 [Helicobacter sp. 11S02629-2]